MKISQTLGIILGLIGIFFLDLGFNGSAASDLFFPPQLRNALPPAIANASLPPSSPPAGFSGYLPAGQNIYFYVIGAIFLGAGMLLLIVTARRARQESFSGRELSSPGATKTTTV